MAWMASENEPPVYVDRGQGAARGLGFEVGTYVFRVVPPGGGKEREERGKYIGVYRVESEFR